MSKDNSLWNVMSWPKWPRRIFLLTFPISVPLYIVAALLAMVVLFIIIFIIFAPITWAYELWTGEKF